MTAPSRTKYDDTDLRRALVQYLSASPPRQMAALEACRAAGEVTSPALPVPGALALILAGRVLCGARRLGVDVALPLGEDEGSARVARTVEAVAAALAADLHLGSEPHRRDLHTRRAAEAVVEQAVCGTAGAHASVSGLALGMIEHVACSVASDIAPGLDPVSGLCLCFVSLLADLRVHLV